MSTSFSRLARVSVAAVVVPVGLLAVAAPAQAATRSTVAHERAAAQHDIDVRLVALRQDARLLAASPSVTPAHRTRLSTIISDDSAGLTALRAKIGTDTDAATLRADHRRVFTDYRVFALVGPQVALTLADDRLAGNASALDARTAALVGHRELARRQLDQARRLLHDVQQLTAAGTASVLALTPADVPDGVTPVEVDEARGQLQAARADFQAAERHLRAARQADRATAESKA